MDDFGNRFYLNWCIALTHISKDTKVFEQCSEMDILLLFFTVESWPHPFETNDMKLKLCVNLSNFLSLSTFIFPSNQIIRVVEQWHPPDWHLSDNFLPVWIHSVHLSKYKNQFQYTIVRVADRPTIFHVSHLAHLHIYWLADYHTYILEGLLLFSPVTSMPKK